MTQPPLRLAPVDDEPEPAPRPKLPRPVAPRVYAVCPRCGRNFSKITGSAWLETENRRRKCPGCNRYWLISFPALETAGAAVPVTITPYVPPVRIIE